MFEKKKVLDYNGNVVDKAKIKVYRTKICRYGRRCFSQKCDFVHDVERTVNQEMLSEKCKYGNKCTKKRNCMFLHEADKHQTSDETVMNDRTIRKYEDIPAWYLTHETRDGQWSMANSVPAPTQRSQMDSKPTQSKEQIDKRISAVIKNWENRNSSGIKVWRTKN